MTELLILRGPPASGKTTFAREADSFARVSRDDIRFQVYGAYHGGNIDEQVVTQIEHAQIDALLRAGKDTLVDATNLNPKFVNKLLRLAGQHGAIVNFHDVTAPLTRALQNDSVRENRGERFVGAKVIRDFYKRYGINETSGALRPAPRPFEPPTRYVPDVTKPIAYGFDLDGTLALHTNARGSTRNPYDTSRYHEDSVNEALRNIIWALADEERDNKILILTGRDAAYRDVVEGWLRKHDVPYDGLFMRPEGDRRPDFVVKAELFDTYIAPHYNFLAQFDDRFSVIQSLRSKGITVYGVTGDGDF